MSVIFLSVYHPVVYPSIIRSFRLVCLPSVLVLIPVLCSDGTVDLLVLLGSEGFLKNIKESGDGDPEILSLSSWMDPPFGLKVSGGLHDLYLPAARGSHMLSCRRPDRRSRNNPTQILPSYSLRGAPCGPLWETHNHACEQTILNTQKLMHTWTHTCINAQMNPQLEKSHYLW